MSSASKSTRNTSKTHAARSTPSELQEKLPSLPKKVSWQDRVDYMIDKVNGLMQSKGVEYSDMQGDRLENFRYQALNGDLPMSTAWFFLAGKHWDSIRTYVRDYREGEDRKRTQSMDDRVADLIVYLLLFLLIVDEESESD